MSGREIRCAEVSVDLIIHISVRYRNAALGAARSSTVMRRGRLKTTTMTTTTTMTMTTTTLTQRDDSDDSGDKLRKLLLFHCYCAKPFYSHLWFNCAILTVLIVLLVFSFSIALCLFLFFI